MPQNRKTKTPVSKDRPAEWGSSIRHMFGQIADRYDLMNTLMTFGQDRVWRSCVVREAGLPIGGRLLDTGAGTGSIALQARAENPSTEITASDFTIAMMQVGRSRPGGNRIRWCAADALDLPFDEERFDAVTSGYLIRNVANPNRAFMEQFRVLKPGGKVVCLDTSPPGEGPLKPFILFFLKTIIPLLGQVISGNRSAYTYLPQSTEEFMTASELATCMAGAGFVNIRYRLFMLGSMAIHVGKKPVT
ncbi:MAG: ubiquinone/menaquinone biosynthesis methyltransferase [Desulfobacterales bacterium]|nr:ubiquinone/menaquinone biosynthesis methyltransferase [Desulfobacterales bacterium]